MRKDVMDSRCRCFVDSIWNGLGSVDQQDFVAELLLLAWGGVVKGQAATSSDVIRPDSASPVDEILWDYEVAGYTCGVVYFRLSRADKIEARKLLDYLQSL